MGALTTLTFYDFQEYCNGKELASAPVSALPKLKVYVEAGYIHEGS